MEAQADQDTPSPTKCGMIIFSLWTPPSVVSSFEHLCYDNLQSDCQICRVQFGKKKKFHGSKFFSKAHSWLVRGTIQLGELYTNLLFPWKSQFQAVLREAGDTEFLVCSPDLAAPRAVGTEMEHKPPFIFSHLPPGFSPGQSGWRESP